MLGQRIKLLLNLHIVGTTIGAFVNRTENRHQPVIARIESFDKIEPGDRNIRIKLLMIRIAHAGEHISNGARCDKNSRSLDVLNTIDPTRIFRAFIDNKVETVVDRAARPGSS